jgi:pteridine reductase
MTGHTALVTGAGRRLGAAIAEALHGAGYTLALHYRNSSAEAEALCRRLNERRADSARTLQGDLVQTDSLAALVDRAAGFWSGLTTLVNNASGFYPTPFGQVDATQWTDLLASNLTAPFFLSQAAAPYLRVRQGSIVNIVDIHAERMLKDYPVYSIAKAGLVAMTKSLAKELAPRVRVNAVAPGAILWPESNEEEVDRSAVLERILLGRTGRPEDVARAVVYLAVEAEYVTGQILAVDGGRTLFS